MQNLTALLLLLVCLTGCASTPICRLENRAVIDVGSGTTKMTVGEVEICPESTKLVRVLDASQTRPLALEASKDKEGQISEDARKQALTAVRELVTAAARSFSALKIAIVATHAVRTASNRGSFEDQMRSEGLPVRVLTQEEEGRAGFAASHDPQWRKSCEGKSITVWDIGGGSQQLSTSGGVQGWSLGAEGFKNALIAQSAIQLGISKCKMKDKPLSPNPIGKRAAPATLALAKRMLNDSGKRHMPRLEGACVIGVGGVHNGAVVGALKAHSDLLRACTGAPFGSDGYGAREVRCLAEYLTEKSDCDAELAGPYSTTAVSNLYLVLAFMELTGVERVLPSKFGIGHAMLTAPLEFSPIAKP